jgi:uncharacterized membrane protein YtjA (UPF0391 family)
MHWWRIPLGALVVIGIIAVILGFFGVAGTNGPLQSNMFLLTLAGIMTFACGALLLGGAEHAHANNLNCKRCYPNYPR